MNLHSFDPQIAKSVGVNAAVIYQNLVFWVEKNAANKTHFHDGQYWTYNSISAFTVLFPYLTEKQIRTALDKLEKDGFIVSSNHNRNGYDRTKWYAICPSSNLPSGANGSAQEGKPIPDSKPDIKQTINIRARENSGPRHPHTLPADWRPKPFDPKSTCHAISKDWDAEKRRDVLARFRSHHQAKGTKFVNWQAAWQTWILNTKKFDANGFGGNRNGYALASDNYDIGCMAGDGEWNGLA